MNISDLSMLVLAAIPILYRGWSGWRYGASVELRYLLMFLFGMLVAIRYWEPCTTVLCESVTFDPRWVAILAFGVLLGAGVLVAGFAVNLRSKFFQSAKANYVEHLLGVLAGLFTGVLMGACLIWLSTVVMPGKFKSMSQVQALIDLPREVVRAIETVVGVAPDSSDRTRYPEVTMVPVPVEGEGAEPGVILMRDQGLITWN